MIDNWVKDIGRYWQREDGQLFLSCGRKISFALEARARIEPDAPSLPGHHRLNVVEVPEGGVYHSNVQWLSADKDVTEDEGEGSQTSTAGKGDQSGVAAHLFGHWLGLPDEFCPDPTGDGTIVCSKAGPVCQRRFEDADTSLMARDPAMGRTSSGKVLQRHAERATELHHLFDDEICIEAVHTVIEQDVADAGSCEYIWDASTRLELSGRADSEGRVRGIGYITSQAKERSQGDCNAEGAGELLDEFAWTGTLRGQFINIELPAGMSYEVKITETVAGHKLDLSEEHTPPYRLKLVGHLSEASGRFKREWTERPTAEKTVDYELRA